MNTITHDTVAQLHKFVVQQAQDDSSLSPQDRRHQAEVVAEVIEQEHLKPNVSKSLLNDYFESLASMRSGKRLA